LGKRRARQPVGRFQRLAQPRALVLAMQPVGLDNRQHQRRRRDMRVVRRNGRRAPPLRQRAEERFQPVEHGIQHLASPGIRDQNSRNLPGLSVSSSSGATPGSSGRRAGAGSSAVSSTTGSASTTGAAAVSSRESGVAAGAGAGGEAGGGAVSTTASSTSSGRAGGVGAGGGGGASGTGSATGATFSSPASTSWPSRSPGTRHSKASSRPVTGETGAQRSAT